MIEKKIHYIWLGKNKKPNTFHNVLESWKRFAPGFTIKEWNDDNVSEFDLPEYYHKAIREKKWAFASDVLRMHILKRYGGVYLDTDQMIIKDISPLWLNELKDVELFTASYHEVDNYFGVQFIGAVKNHKLIDIIQNFYKNYSENNFIIVNKVFSKILNDEISKNKNFIEEEKIKIFKQEYFYPLNKESYTDNTFSFHLGNVSWQPAWKHLLYKYKIYFWLKNKLKKLIPKNIKY